LIIIINKLNKINYINKLNYIINKLTIIKILKIINKLKILKIQWIIVNNNYILLNIKYLLILVLYIKNISQTKITPYNILFLLNSITIILLIYLTQYRIILHYKLSNQYLHNYLNKINLYFNL